MWLRRREGTNAKQTEGEIERALHLIIKPLTSFRCHTPHFKVQSVKITLLRTDVDNYIRKETKIRDLLPVFFSSCLCGISFVMTILSMLNQRYGLAGRFIAAKQHSVWSSTWFWWDLQAERRFLACGVHIMLDLLLDAPNFCLFLLVLLVISVFASLHKFLVPSLFFHWCVQTFFYYLAHRLHIKMDDDAEISQIQVYPLAHEPMYVAYWRNYNQAGQLSLRVEARSTNRFTKVTVSRCWAFIHPDLFPVTSAQFQDAPFGQLEKVSLNPGSNYASSHKSKLPAYKRHVPMTYLLFPLLTSLSNLPRVLSATLPRSMTWSPPSIAAARLSSSPLCSL